MILRAHSNRGVGLLGGLLALSIVTLLLAVLPADTASSVERTVEIVRLLPAEKPPPAAATPEPPRERPPEPRPADPEPSKPASTEQMLASLDALLAASTPTETDVPEVTRRSTAQRTAPAVQADKALSGLSLLASETESATVEIEQRREAVELAVPEGRFQLGTVAAADRHVRSSGEMAEVRLEQQKKLLAEITASESAWRQAIGQALSRMRQVKLPTTVLEHIGLSDGAPVRYLRRGNREYYFIYVSARSELRVLVLEGQRVEVLVGTNRLSRYRSGSVSYSGGQPVAIETIERPPQQAEPLYQQIMEILVTLAS